MAKRKKQTQARIVKTYRLAGDDDIEAIIKLAVSAQARLAKQGIQLHWSMSWSPAPSKPA